MLGAKASLMNRLAGFLHTLRELHGWQKHTVHQDIIPIRSRSAFICLRSNQVLLTI